MKHRILLGLSVFLLPSVVGALGLGKLELLSALHEPFHAQVELLSASPAELDSLRLSLADSEAFARAGIPRKLILTRLRFSVRETETGSDYIEIRSVVPIREPFLNFLLEVNWSKGRLYKEYTALLDPPKDVLPPPQKRQVPADLERDKRGIIRRPAPAPATPTTTRAIDYTGGDYGPAVTGDTLWSIAKATRPDTSVSIQQMMLAIVRLNPTAFIENNINGLRRGAILKMPDITEIATLGKPDAFASVHEQNMLWDAYRGRVAEQPLPTVVPVPSPPTPIQAEPTPPPAEAPSPEPTPPPAEAPSPEPTPAPAPTPPTQPAEQSELKLITETDGESAVQDAPSLDLEAGELANELALKSEAIEALLMEGAQLQDRLGENEIIINDLQRLIALKEDSLALIQEQARMADEEVIDETVVAEAGSEQAAPVAPEPEKTVPEDSVRDSDIAEQEGQTTESFIGLADIIEKAKEWVEKAKPHLPMIGAILGGVLFLVISLLALSRWRQRKSDEELLVIDDLDQTGDIGDVSDSEITEISESMDDISDDEITQTGEGAGDLDITQTGEGAGDLDVFDIGDEDKTAISVGQGLPEVQVDEEEQDSMEQINLLLVYEQFNDAADAINQALQDDPNNLEYLGKLLEVYYAAGNKKAYEEIAKRIHEQTNGTGNYWDIAVAMWSELSPKRELFSTPTDDEEESVVSGDTGVLNIAGEGSADEDMDFDIGGDSLDDGAETMPGMEASPSLDFLEDEEKEVLDISSDSGESEAPSLEDSDQSLSITTGEDQVSDLTATSMTEDGADIADESDDTLGGVDLDFTEIDYDTNAPDEDGVALETEDEDADSLSFAVDDEAAESVTEEVAPPPPTEDEDADSLSFAVDDEAAESVIEEVAPPPPTEDEDADSLSFAVDDEAAESVIEEVAPPPPTEDEDADSLSFAVDDEAAESVTEEVAPPPPTEDEDADSLSFAVDDEAAESVTEEVAPPPPTEDEDADSLSFAVDDEAAESVTEEVAPPPPTEDEDADSLSFAVDDEAAESVTEEVAPPPPTEDEDADSLSFAVDDEAAESVTEEVAPPPPTEDDQSSEQPIEETIIDTRFLEPLAMQAAADKKAGGLLDESAMVDFDADEDLLDITTTTASVNEGEDLDSLGSVAEDESDLEKTPALLGEDPLSSDITDPELAHDKTVQLPRDKNPQEADEEEVKYDQTLLIPKSPALQEQSEDEEMASQLDLAKAYIELGERDSAKLILDDILKHGDVAYRRQAEELNEQLK